MNKTFDRVENFYENAEFSNFYDFDFDFVADIVLIFEDLPRIFGQLFDAERESLFFRVDIENDCFDFVAFLVVFRRVFQFSVPGNIAGSDQTVDTLFNTNEKTEIGNVADSSLYDGSYRIFVFEKFPWIRLDLLHAERNSSVLDVDFKDFDFDFVADCNHFARVFDSSCPGHFGNVDETFNAFFKLNESAVVFKRNDNAFNRFACCVFFGSVDPRIVGDLFYAEADSFGIFVVFKDFNINFVADFEHFGRMIYSAP